MLDEELFFKKIKNQLAANLPFVVYKKPSQNEINAVLQKGDELYVTNDYTESGFVFAPFRDDEKAILIPPDNCLKSFTPTHSVVDILNETYNSSDEEGKKEYKQLIVKAITAIKTKKIDKVVLSRVEEVELVEENTVEVFQKLFVNYPAALVYLWFHPKVGMWMGASPETLLKIDGTSFSTMSLAGTQSYQGKKDVSWGGKEKKEQQIVTDAIVSGLEKIEVISDIKISPVQTIKAGSLLHLKTDITATLKSVEIKKIVKEIHPTPAICGFPRVAAKKFIVENENYNRTYYTGFLGELNMTLNEDKKLFSNLFVNLRCMQLKNKHAHIYVGGGITIDSDPEAEWLETRNKSKTMKKVLFDVK